MLPVMDTSINIKTTMKFRNSGNKSVEVELISDDVEIRIGETKWSGVAYVREGRSKVYVRTKAEFKAKFVPMTDATS